MNREELEEQGRRESWQAAATVVAGVAVATGVLILTGILLLLRLK